MKGAIELWDNDVIRRSGGIRVQHGDERQTEERPDDLGRNETGRDGAIPAKASENIGPTVTAGLANEVELEN